jgi:hypothetical protein
MSSGSYERGGNTAACLLSAKTRREGYMDYAVEAGLLLFFFILLLLLVLLALRCLFFFPLPSKAM